MASTPAMDPVVLDGRTLEGGGQLLRIALCLSALTSIPIRIHSIRGNRAGGGGLKAQHLACVKWLAHACRAKVEGAEKGSKELLFVPTASAGELSPAFKKVKVIPADGKETSDIYEAKLDIGTAGSTGLALQAILPFILFTQLPSPLPVRLTLSGGTNVSQSPSYEYITQVLLPTLHRVGFPVIESKLGKRGWSQGGNSIGNFTLEIPYRASVALPAFSLTPPKLAQASEAKPEAMVQHLHATFVAPSTCHDHFRISLKKSLKYHFPQPRYPSFTEAHDNLTVELEESRHHKRMYLILVATMKYEDPSAGTHSPSKPAPTTFKLGRDWLYDRKLPNNPSVSSHNEPAETMADKVTADLAAEVESGACVDEHMRDQLVVFQALAKGDSAIFGGASDDGKGALREPSLHARTAEWVAERLLSDQGVRFDGEGGAVGMGFGIHEEVMRESMAGLHLT